MLKEKKFYLTKQGFEKLKKEYKDLNLIKSAKIKGEIPQILHSEDVNTEYLSFHEDLNFLEVRMTDLEHILKNTELITFPAKNKQDIINLGATVVVEVNNQEDEFMIVGTLEANPVLGKISNESPVGKALIGHRVGDKVVISSTIKTIYKIKKIEYSLS